MAERPPVMERVTLRHSGSEAGGMMKVGGTENPPKGVTMLEVDRRAFFEGLGGAGAVAAMSPEAKADALEHHMMRLLDEAAAGGGPAKKKYPSAAEVEAQVETRRSRRGVRNLFLSSAGNVSILPRMPEKPTLMDFFK